jgi:hypothetical protein
MLLLSECSTVTPNFSSQAHTGVADLWGLKLWKRSYFIQKCAKKKKRSTMNSPFCSAWNSLKNYIYNHSWDWNVRNVRKKKIIFNPTQLILWKNLFRRHSQKKAIVDTLNQPSPYVDLSLDFNNKQILSERFDCSS